MRLLVLLAFVSLSAIAQQAVRPARKIVLFDGKSLDRFYVWLRETKLDDPRRVFRVENKMLRITGEDWGGITTKESFRDYRLIVEWKWGGPTHGNRVKSARDSGILIHARGEDGAASGVWLESIESQIIEGGTGDIILVAGKTRPWLTVETRTGPDKQLYWEPGGEPTRRDRGRFNWRYRDVDWKDSIGYRGPRDLERPVGQWNRQEILCDGARVVMKLNGVVVNEGRDADPSEGKIQIQSEGAEIWIRRIELHPIKR
jgi:hypothetical protein